MNDIWQTRRFQLDLSRPQVMGIVNMTPDSFSDGGNYSANLTSALKHAEQLVHDGADILDIGGESTRPNASYVSPEQEWQRIEPILSEVSHWNIPISIDTRRSEIMNRALSTYEVDIINDIQSLEDNNAIEVLKKYADVGICLMHMQNSPENMQNNPQYHHVINEVGTYLNQRVQACLSAGIHLQRLVLDVGFGFGKTLQHNLDLMRHLSELIKQLKLPFLVGISRKRIIGELTGRELAHDRDAGSLAAALFAIQQGAKIVRVHQVRQCVDALKVWNALSTSSF